MRDDDGTTARRPRPVADAPIGPFALGTGLAKAWLLELVAGAPLAEVGRIPVDRFGIDAPPLCSAVCRALADEATLDRLGPDGSDHALVQRVAAITATAEVGHVVAAVETLRRVTWRALSEELRPADLEIVGALADRLAHVCAVVSAGAVSAVPQPERTGPLDVNFHDRVVTLHDARVPDEDEPWVRALERALVGHRADGAPVAVLLLEADDLDRLRSTLEPDDLTVALQRLERVATSQLHPTGVPVVQEPGRYWAVLGGVDPETARRIAAELAEAVVSLPQAALGGALHATVGIACAPRDGLEMGALLERAETEVYRARAAGVPVGG